MNNVQYIDRQPGNNTKSVYQLPITNSLGLDAKKSRALLKTFALTKPAEYSQARMDVYDNVVKALVTDAHKVIWELLANGKFQGRFIFTGHNDLPNWSPNLPDSQIGTISNGFASSIMDNFEEILNIIMPDDYKSMAEAKMGNMGRIGLTEKPE